MDKKQNLTTSWFRELRDKICNSFELLEQEHRLCSDNHTIEHREFQRTVWKRPGGGGGEMSLMRGYLFEKVGVNISVVFGRFSEKMQKLIPGAEHDPSFFAAGISVVAHMQSPLIPAVHFNTRYIRTQKEWFGGGSDLTPLYQEIKETSKFHTALKNACDLRKDGFYDKYKKKCDEYFYLKHRKEPRGVGGIFYDYLDEDFDKDFVFIKNVGVAFLDVYSSIVSSKMKLKWSDEQREELLKKRGRYVEFNLLYDRGTAFGFETNGNIDAIMMSMPPEVKW